MKIFGLLILGCCMAGGVFAQVNMQQDACNKIWGSPESGELDEHGDGALRYHSRETDITLEFERSYVLRAVYRKSAMNERDIDSLLRMNNGHVEWAAWSPPGIPPEELLSTTWLRTDDRAMARFQDGVLQVVGSPEPDEQPEKMAVAEKTEENGAEVVAVPAPAVAAAPTKQKARAVPPKVSVPKTMPAVGDSKMAALRLLGEPSGIMESGDKEILVYAWGSVWVANNKVIQVN